MAPSPHLHPLSTPLLLLLLTSLLPAASASNNATANLNTAGFWLSFCLLVVVSDAEAAASFFWTRYRAAPDGQGLYDLSCRVCGRQISHQTIGAESALQLARHGLPAGCSAGSTAYSEHSINGVVTYGDSSGNGCSCFGGWESTSTVHVNGATEVVIDKFGSVFMIPYLLIRRFNPSMSLEAPAGLVDNFKDLFKEAEEMSAGRKVERLVHLLIGLTDISLGAAGLALNTRSPQRLYHTLKDPTAPMTFGAYSTLFLLYWLLGLVLLLCTIPLHSKRKNIQMFGWPGAIAFAVATLANLALFGLGCWKLDYARRHHLPWRPMLSYWIGGASAISFPLFGVEVFHTFGVVGLILMLIHIL